MKPAPTKGFGFSFWQKFPGGNFLATFTCIIVRPLLIGFIMKSWNEIQAMTKEEVAQENRRLVKRLVLTKIVAPIAITAVVHYGVNYLVNRLDNSDND
ncbi:hypothetical protein SEA_SCAP1_29 [Streptomyces phage Scap1]|uniref:Uncharacterized protein n=1 Tax=Streptomyces phage Scap1 TaxID=2041354 RepID=A0A2D1GNZ2_9CAUD|nr:hypothetical protein FDI71_gp29 [Streptomyces phage Scap1]ATN93678.1 hypothetical protein SEA_SCAP1_29 [Streptomyces phage Scap1]